MEAISTADGTTVYVSSSEGDRGSKAPFYVVYETSKGEERYGWFCDHCAGTDVAMDSMGRIQCNHCGNLRKPTEWDAAHE